MFVSLGCSNALSPLSLNIAVCSTWLLRCLIASEFLNLTVRKFWLCKRLFANRSDVLEHHCMLVLTTEMSYSSHLSSSVVDPNITIVSHGHGVRTPCLIHSTLSKNHYCLEASGVRHRYIWLSRYCGSLTIVVCSMLSCSQLSHIVLRYTLSNCLNNRDYLEVPVVRCL